MDKKKKINNKHHPMGVKLKNFLQLNPEAVEVILDDETPCKIVECIAQKMNAEAKVDCAELTLSIPKIYGEGKIVGYKFDDGISLLLLDCQLKEDLILKFATSVVHPIHFNFCTDGGFSHVLWNGDIQYNLNPLLGTITSNPKGCEQWFIFPKETRILVTNLQILRENYSEKVSCQLEELPERLASAFKDVGGERPFFYQSNYSINIAECIKEITTTKHEGLVRTTFVESKALELLAMQIKQYEDDLSVHSRRVLLRKFDVEKIRLAKEILTTNLKDAPIIKDLAKKVGINQQKLKKGFKTIFGTTINKYLRAERMERAKLLILEGSLSLREISSEVGYSNQSHFAKRFKEKFGVLPKDFSKTIKTNISD